MPQKNAAQEIKARINILDVVRRYVDLRRVGSRWVAPCPFHQETKPSFSVNEEEGFFYCFGCQAAGDVIEFHKRITGLDFRESLEALAEEAGISLADSRADSRTDRPAGGRQNPRKTALLVCDLARIHFRKNLASKAGADCRAYLENRGIGPAIAESFELGWALPQWRGLAEALRQAGFSPEQGVEAGLLAPGERGSYDRFRGRLIFPIKNPAGQAIAFGGRILGGEDAAKYINSTDSAVYKKGEHLYGLFQARRAITARQTALVTEGYMDVLTLHQSGYENSCAVLGTALTEEQIRRLAGFCSRLELVFDGDAPGRKAALRACGMVLARGLSCSVVLLPDQEDIDSLLRSQGKDAFEDLRGFAPDGLDFCIRSLARLAPREALDWVKSFLSGVRAPELLSRYISRLSQGLDLDEGALRRGLPAIARLQETPPVTGKGGGIPRPSVDKDAFDQALLNFVVRFPRHLPVLREAGAALLLTEDWAAALWGKVESCAPSFAPDLILQELDEGEREFWGRRRVMSAPPPDHEQEELAAICSVIARRCLERQEAAAAHVLHQGVPEAEDADLLKALNETLLQKRKHGSSHG
ncbi:MAG: DNA primase [Deltaproteobacteria bacterium]|jgi:DNA primase|nr:DNA primase [Deltaproteobacteria bacterium]